MYNNTPAEALDWSKAFDLNKINDPRGRTQRYFRTPNKTNSASIEKTDNSFDLGSESRYDSFNELRARAGQLKDYISMKRGIPLNQDFKVTMSDLNYAINNYIKDVGLDNQMSAYFKALTDKNHLLKCMNKYALGTAGLISVGLLTNSARN
jgi:NAD+--asparagine ADP-ribosyltransferase